MSSTPKQQTRPPKPASKAELMWVDVAQARKWLLTNHDNRSLSRLHVRNLVRLMEQGRFKYNADPIRFDENGDLTDGQHRLTAVVHSERGQWLLIAGNIPRSYVRTMDVGLKRSVGHWFKMQGHKSPTTVAASARMLYAFEQGFLSQLGSGFGKFYPQEADAVLQRHPDLKISIQECFTRKQDMKRVFRSDAGAGFFHYLFTRVDPVAGADFMVRWADGAGLTKDSPILKLRNVLNDDLHDPRKKLNTKVRFGLVLKAWKFHCKGQTVKVLRYSPKDKWPGVFGFKYLKGKPVFPK